LLHSLFHEVWALVQGTQLREKESGFRYTPQDNMGWSGWGKSGNLTTYDTEN
jgi:hypothetical protein